MDQAKQDKILAILKDQLKTTPRDGVYTSLTGDLTPAGTAGSGLVGRLQDWLKARGNIYYFLVRAFTPVVFTQDFNRTLSQTLAMNGQDKVILNIGSGPTRLTGRGDIINVDMFAFPEVDVCALAHDLPFTDNSVDLIVSIAALEHTANPQAIVAEMSRVLRPGGMVLCYVPFMQPFHAAPFDFQRWTMEGLKVLFADFHQARTGLGAGATSGLLWIFAHWFSLIFCLGSSKLRDVLYLGCMFVTSPLKYLDLLLSRQEACQSIASAYYIQAVK